MKYWLMIPLILLSFAAQANDSGTFIYTKTIIRIVPKSGNALPIPAMKPVDPSGMIPILNRAPKEFTVEVRDASFLTQKDFITHQPFTDREGMLILVDPPAEAQLKATRMITEADVLFVDADGIIVKIAPSLKLSTLTETIESGGPIHAFVYLKEGTTAAYDISVGDRVENSFFKTHPIILQ